MVFRGDGSRITDEAVDLRLLRTAAITFSVILQSSKGLWSPARKKKTNEERRGGKKDELLRLERSFSDVATHLDA